MKRTLLASFTDILLLPVTIVPRTVGAVGAAITTGLTTGGKGAVQGIQMLNPQRWVTGVSDGYSGAGEKRWMGVGGGDKGVMNGYKGLGEGVAEAVMFDIGPEVDEDEEVIMGEKTREKEIEKTEEMEVDIGISIKEERWGDDVDGENDSGTGESDISYCMCVEIF